MKYKKFEIVIVPDTTDPTLYGWTVNDEAGKEVGMSEETFKDSKMAQADAEKFVDEQ